MMRALFLLYAIWGFNWVVMKTANAYFPPVLFVAFRFLIGAAVMLSVCAWRRIPVPMTAVSIVLAGAAAWAASGIILKRHLQDSPPLQYSAWQMVVGSLLLFIVALIVHGEGLIAFLVHAKHIGLADGRRLAPALHRRPDCPTAVHPLDNNSCRLSAL